VTVRIASNSVRIASSSSRTLTHSAPHVDTQHSSRTMPHSDKQWHTHFLKSQCPRNDCTTCTPEYFCEHERHCPWYFCEHAIIASDLYRTRSKRLPHKIISKSQSTFAKQKSLVLIKMSIILYKSHEQKRVLLRILPPPSPAPPPPPPPALCPAGPEPV